MAVQRSKPPAGNNDWLGNTIIGARIQEIGPDDKWHTLGECVDAPNALERELRDPKYQGHLVWIRNALGERHYHGLVK